MKIKYKNQENIKTGINRPLDNLGRIVIPMEIRKSLGINKGDRLSINVQDQQIILEKVGSNNKTITLNDLKRVLKKYTSTENIEQIIKEL